MKKSGRKKKSAPAKKRRAPRRKAAARAPARKKKAAPKKRSVKKAKPARKRPAPRRTASKRRPTASRKALAPRPYIEADEETLSADFDVSEPPTERGLGLESGGQSGDTEGLSRMEIADSESVEELVEEGQAFEAGVISGVENAPDADAGGVRTREVPEDDVPQEYLDEQ
jgi:hypothetical protein